MKRDEAPPIAPPPAKSGGPVFDEPWHAQVLAIAHALTREGAFTPGQWAEALGAQLRRAETRGDPDTQQTYYAAALAALEGLVAANGAVAGDSLETRIEAWRSAYLNTPHGQPVELAAADAPKS